MADVDLLPARGIRGYAVVDENGIAVGGTLTVLQLAQRGMRSICAVDSNGLASGGSTVLQLRARGIMPCCPVSESAVSTDNGTAILTLMQRGLNPKCPVTALGVAQGGSATMVQLAQKGIEGFCPLTEAGAQTTFGVVAFSGPGDIVSGAIEWWGLRAYSTATKGSNAVRIRRNSDNAEQDFVTLTTGALDRTSISTFLNATTGAFVTFYDQTGNGHHLTNATAASQATVNLSGLGSFVTADFTVAASHTYLSTGNVTQAQPVTVSNVANHTASASQHNLMLQGGTNQIGYRNSAANQVFLFAGSVLAATAADGSWHSLQAVFNGASSDMNVDGTANSGNGGTGFFDADRLTLGFAGGQGLDGKWLEGGAWPGAFTGTQSSDMSANAHTYWGF